MRGKNEKSETGRREGYREEESGTEGGAVRRVGQRRSEESGTEESGTER